MTLAVALAPAHQCPAQLDAATSAYRQLLDGYNVLPNKVIIAGDSAGGELFKTTLCQISTYMGQRTWPRACC